MAGENQASSTETSAEGTAPTINNVQNVNPAKIEVVKFNGRNNFGMWRCEMYDALLAQSLEETIDEDRKPAEMSEKDWVRKNKMACGLMRSCLSQDIKYKVMTEMSAKKIWDKLNDKYQMKTMENRLHLKRRLYRFQWEKGHTVHDHIDAFDKLLADLLNHDVEIEEEDKSLILLNSLPLELEYDTFVTSLLSNRSTLTYDEATGAIINFEMRKKHRVASGSSSGEALSARGRSKEQSKGNRSRSKSKPRVAKDQCWKCKQHGHWARECPEWENGKGKSKESNSSEASVARSDGNDSDSSIFTLSILSDANISGGPEWMLDTGATYHICPRREWFSSLKEVDGAVDGARVHMGNGSTSQIEGVGAIRIRMHDGMIREVSGVRYVPTMRKCIISVGALEAEGLKARIENGILRMTKGSLIVMKGVRRGHLYYLQGSIEGGTLCTSENDDGTLEVWKKRLGLTCIDPVRELAQRGVIDGVSTYGGIAHDRGQDDKQKRVKFDTVVHRPKGILEVVHVDVWGPTKTASIGGHHWFVSFVDEYSRYCWVAPMSRKGEVLEVYKKWKKCVELQTGRKIQGLQFDNAGKQKYVKDPFRKICLKEGIRRLFIPREANRKQLDGIAKSMNRTLLERVRSLMSNSGVERTLWVEALTYACHLMNRLPNAAIGARTPIEVWSGSAATDYGMLRIFGCQASCIKDARGDSKARRFLFLGFRGAYGYKLWDQGSRRIILRKQVDFDETSAVKFQSFQYVESKQIGTVSQPVEYDATPQSPSITVSRRLPVNEIQRGDQVARIDTVPSRSQRQGLRFQNITAEKELKKDKIGSLHDVRSFGVNDKTKGFRSIDGAGRDHVNRQSARRYGKGDSYVSTKEAQVCSDDNSARCKKTSRSGGVQDTIGSESGQSLVITAQKSMLDC